MKAAQPISTTVDIIIVLRNIISILIYHHISLSTLPAAVDTIRQKSIILTTTTHPHLALVIIILNKRPRSTTNFCCRYPTNNKLSFLVVVSYSTI